MIEYIEEVILYALGFVAVVAVGALAIASIVGFCYGVIMWIAQGVFAWYLPVGLAVMAILFGVGAVMYDD